MNEIGDSHVANFLEKAFHSVVCICSKAFQGQVQLIPQKHYILCIVFSSCGLRTISVQHGL
uniref:Ubiquinone biosynthesis protein coq-8 n=1 Tax=Solanum tuberosum TaxID=4113 RepID=M1C8P6_SOLTU